jgi:putative ABC transport system substrate-binding protein
VWADRLRGFHDGLKETGYIEGQNVSIEYRWADGKFDRLPALATELVRRQVAVIALGGTPAARAAKVATSSIPVVFTIGGDPIELGLVGALNRPGGNVTGVATLESALGPKQLQLLRELVPTATSFGLLVNPANHVLAEAISRDMQAAADAVGVRLISRRQAPNAISRRPSKGSCKVGLAHSRSAPTYFLIRRALPLPYWRPDTDCRPSLNFASSLRLAAS